MSVESSKARRAQQSELSDLQSEYTQKKKKYARQQEEELGEMKEFYNQRKEETRTQGAAAINHIRRKQSETLDSVAENREKMVKRSEAQLDDIDQDYRKKINETRTRRQAEVEEARLSSKEKLAEIQGSQQKKVEKVREEAHRELAVVKDKFNKELHQTEDFTNKRLAQVKENNQMTLDHELEKGRQTQDKLRTNLKTDYDKTETTGKQAIAERRDYNEKKYTRQEGDYEKRFGKQQEQWETREKGLNEQYQNRISHSKKTYEQQLKDQHKHFESTYGKNENANRESLRIQNSNFLKEQVEMKKKFFKESEKYANKEEDPFYKLQERGNRLRENPDFYIIEAYVPEHEKDNIKVTIKDDMASVSGKRAFKDEIEEEGRKLSTNSYQTFREEFNFEKPVITQGMTRERDGDYVTFWVPKLNSFDGVRKINKKA